MNEPANEDVVYINPREQYGNDVISPPGSIIQGMVLPEEFFSTIRLKNRPTWGVMASAHDEGFNMESKSELCCLIGCVSGIVLSLVAVAVSLSVLTRSEPDIYEDANTIEPGEPRHLGSPRTDLPIVIPQPEVQVVAEPSYTFPMLATEPSTSPAATSPTVATPKGATTQPLTPPTTRMPSTSATTSSTTTTTTTTSTVVPSTNKLATTQRSAVHVQNPLLCTVGIELSVGSALPEDGLCDFIFYESFYLKLHPTGWSNPAMQHFLAVGRQMLATEIGASFSPLNDQLFTDVGQGAFKNAVVSLQRQGVSHFGILNMYGIYTTSTKFVECLNALKQIYTYAEHGLPPTQNRKTSIYTVIGAVFDQPHLYRNIDKTKGVFEPSLYISVSHLSYPDRTNPNCRILPMTLLDFPQDPPRDVFTYGISILEAMRNIKWTQRNNPGLERMAISFSMRGHFYAPSNASSNYSGSDGSDLLFRPCTDFVASAASFDSYDIPPTSACGSAHSFNYYYRDGALGEFSYDPGANLVLTFDSEVALRKKVCEAKAAYSDVTFGIAVFDITYDASAGGCGSFQIGPAPFRRIKALKSVNELPNDISLQECLITPI